MKHSKKMVWLILGLLILSIAPVCASNDSTELPSQKTVISFLSDVVHIDVSQYVANPISYSVDYPKAYGELPHSVGLLRLSSVNSEIDVDYTTINGSLVSCGLTINKGTPLLTVKLSDIQDKTQDFLSRYQEFAQAPYVEPVINMITSLDLTKNTSSTSDNVKLTVTNEDNLTIVKAYYTADGADFPQKSIGVTFKNGIFYDFGNGWNLYKIGSEGLQISREQAIEIALMQAKNYTFQVSQGTDNYSTVNFTIDESKTVTTLSAGPREPLTLYPVWNIQLYFDKLYYNYYGIQAVIWADTGQIDFFNPTGMGGGFPTINETTAVTNTPSAMPSITEIGEIPLSTNTILLGIVIIVITSCAIVLALNKKRRI